MKKVIFTLVAILVASVSFAATPVVKETKPVLKQASSAKKAKTTKAKKAKAVKPEVKVEAPKSK